MTTERKIKRNYIEKKYNKNELARTQKYWAKSEEFSVSGKGYLGPAPGWAPLGRNAGYVPYYIVSLPK